MPILRALAAACARSMADRRLCGAAGGARGGAERRRSNRPHFWLTRRGRARNRAAMRRSGRYAEPRAAFLASSRHIPPSGCSVEVPPNKFVRLHWLFAPKCVLVFRVLWRAAAGLPSPPTERARGTFGGRKEETVARAACLGIICLGGVATAPNHTQTLAAGRPGAARRRCRRRPFGQSRMPPKTATRGGPQNSCAEAPWLREEPGGGACVQRPNPLGGQGGERGPPAVRARPYGAREAAETCNGQTLPSISEHIPIIEGTAQHQF